MSDEVVIVPCALGSHQFRYLRQEKRNYGYERNPEWRYFDVYYCDRCLNYQYVHVKSTVPHRDTFGEQIVWRGNDRP